MPTLAVTWVEVGTAPILVAANLEEEGVQNWTEVLESPTRPQGAADVFKVRPHGSSDAHHDLEWDEM